MSRLNTNYLKSTFHSKILVKILQNIGHLRKITKTAVTHWILTIGLPKNRVVRLQAYEGTCQIFKKNLYCAMLSQIKNAFQQTQKAMG